MLDEIGLTNSQGRSIVTYKNIGEPLSSGVIEVNAATDGSTGGAWVHAAPVRTEVGMYQQALDVRALGLADGRHAVRITARDPYTQVTYATPFHAIVDGSTPHVTPPALKSLPGFLIAAVTASDPESGLDASRPVGLEVAVYDRDTKAISSGWRPLGDLASTEQGYGLTHALAPGEYVARVVVANSLGMLGRSAPVWFEVKNATDPVPAAAPAIVTVAVRGKAGSGKRLQALRYERLLVTGTVRSEAGATLEGYRVVVRTPAGKGITTRTDRHGRYSIPVRAAHGGQITVLVSRANFQATRTVVVSLVTPVRGGTS